jgi:hypothetical protein
VDHGDARAVRLVRTGETDRLAVEQDLALIFGVDARQDPHEGAFPGAILAGKDVNLALAQVEGNVLEHPVGPKTFTDTPEFQEFLRQYPDLQLDVPSFFTNRTAQREPGNADWARCRLSRLRRLAAIKGARTGGSHGLPGI